MVVVVPRVPVPLSMFSHYGIVALNVSVIHLSSTSQSATEMVPHYCTSDNTLRQDTTTLLTPHYTFSVII